MIRRQLARRLEERRKFREEARLGRTLRWSLRSLMASHGRPEKGTLAAGLAALRSFRNVDPAHNIR